MAERPWISLMDEKDGSWAEYCAWERWMFAELDDTLPHDEPAILDSLNVIQQAYLYNVMCRLADGWKPAGDIDAMTDDEKIRRAIDEGIFIGNMAPLLAMEVRLLRALAGKTVRPPVAKSSPDGSPSRAGQPLPTPVAIPDVIHWGRVLGSAAEKLVEVVGAMKALEVERDGAMAQLAEMKDEARDLMVTVRGLTATLERTQEELRLLANCNAEHMGEAERLKVENAKLERLNADKFAHLQAYCRAADEDRAEIARLKAAIAPFAKVAKTIPDNWPSENVLTFDMSNDNISLDFFGRHDNPRHPTIGQWRALVKAVDMATVPAPATGGFSPLGSPPDV